MKATIVYDNVSLSPEFRSSWGFAAILNVNGKFLLFDTGWDGHLLLSNLGKLNFDVKAIEAVVISHDHWDHAGGLPALLQANSNLRVYVPKSFSKRLKAEIADRARELIEVSEPTKILDDIWSIGELKSSFWGLNEQAILAKTSRNLLLLTGCSHPGVKAIINAAGKLGLGNVSGIAGGLHGFRRLNLLSDMRLIVPCHCTQYKREILERYPDRTLRCGVGLTFEF